MPEKMVKDILKDKGIFSAFYNPIWCYDFDPADLDLYFITNYGEKWSSPFLSYFDEEGGITQENIEKVANAIYRMYKSQWEHLYKVNVAEYDPLDNTNVTETETIGKVGSENIIEGSSTDATTRGTGVSDSTGGGTNTHTREGLGSNNFVSDYQDSMSNNADAASSSSDTSGSSSDNTSVKNYEDDNTRKLTKHGNIGTMTFSDLIRGEQSAWRWNFILGVMSDISDCIALSTY